MTDIVISLLLIPSKNFFCSRNVVVVMTMIMMMMLIMNCYCGMVVRRKEFTLISRRDHCLQDLQDRESLTRREHDLNLNEAVQ